MLYASVRRKQKRLQVLSESVPPCLQLRHAKRTVKEFHEFHRDGSSTENGVYQATDLVVYERNLLCGSSNRDVQADSAYRQQTATDYRRLD